MLAMFKALPIGGKLLAILAALILGFVLYKAQRQRRSAIDICRRTQMQSLKACAASRRMSIRAARSNRS